MRTPLSQEEMDELDKFLLSDSVSDEAMLLDSLDGYLTAIIVGPATIMMSVWLPGVWGPTADDAPAFETLQQAQRMMELIMRHMNDIVWSLQHQPAAFEPLFNTMTYPDHPREYIDGEMWAHGFMRGVALCRQD